jgi:hypothetical protein
VKKGESLTWSHVAMDTSAPAYKVRKEMENLFTPTMLKAA